MPVAVDGRVDAMKARITEIRAIPFGEVPRSDRCGQKERMVKPDNRL
jgi:hypothetical protein